MYPRFLTSALDGGEWAASRPGRFILWERTHGIYQIGGWVDHRTGSEFMEKSLSSSVGIGMGYGLDDRGIEVRLLAGARG
jgi:hypothetical protein